MFAASSGPGPGGIFWVAMSWNSKGSSSRNAGLSFDTDCFNRSFLYTSLFSTLSPRTVFVAQVAKSVCETTWTSNSMSGKPSPLK